MEPPFVICSNEKKKAAAIEGTNLTQPNEAVEIARTDAG